MKALKVLSSRWNTGTRSWKQPARDLWTRMCGPFQVSVSAQQRHGSGRVAKESTRLYSS
jgi:hypothetical protein